MTDLKFMKATYGEWQASLWGACFIAFGLGILIASYLSWLAIPAMAIGVIMHSWGMYRIHQRNR